MSDSLAFASTAELCRRLQSGSVTSRALVELYLDRIERLNGPINAVVKVDADAARRAADARDAQFAAGEIVGPLHGLPMTVKDALEVAGLTTTGGIVPLAEHVPETDADAVAALREAGAAILGKTNVPMMSGDWQSYNDIYGQTGNPYALDRSPGGSSGGAAAALAAGLTGGDIGSDIGGSIRIPAHFCGLYGLKPTYGLISQRGHIPPMPGTKVTMPLSVVGPLGRGAEDLELLFDVMAGRFADGPHGTATPPAPRNSHGRTLRVAVWANDPFSPVDPQIAQAVRAAGEALRRKGCEVEEVARGPIDFAASVEVYETLLSATLSPGFPDHVRERMAKRAAALAPDDTSHEALQARGAALTSGGMQSLIAEADALRGRWADIFADWDAILCPVTQTTAFPHDHEPNFHKRRLMIAGRERPYMDTMHWVGLATLAHLPAATAPVSRDENGLPIGVQIIGPHFEDRTPMAVARLLESAMGGFTPPGLAG